MLSMSRRRGPSPDSPSTARHISEVESSTWSRIRRRSRSSCSTGSIGEPSALHRIAMTSTVDCGPVGGLLWTFGPYPNPFLQQSIQRPFHPVRLRWRQWGPSDRAKRVFAVPDWFQRSRSTRRARWRPIRDEQWDLWTSDERLCPANGWAHWVPFQAGECAVHCDALRDSRRHLPREMVACRPKLRTK